MIAQQEARVYTEKRLELLKHQKSHFLILSVIQQWIDIESFAHLTKKHKGKQANVYFCYINMNKDRENENLSISLHGVDGFVCIYGCVRWVKGKIKEKKKIKFPRAKLKLWVFLSNV